MIEVNSDDKQSCQSSEEEEKVHNDDSLINNNNDNNEELLVAPLILCFDDLQYYDALSFYIIKLLLKNFTRVLVIGLSRD